MLIFGVFFLFLYIGFKTDLLHQHFHFVHCYAKKLFQCTFPLFNTGSENTLQRVFFSDKAHKHEENSSGSEQDWKQKLRLPSPI